MRISVTGGTQSANGPRGTSWLILGFAGDDLAHGDGRVSEGRVLPS
jgi:hypothetical protein